MSNSSSKSSLTSKTISAFLWLGSGSGVQSVIQILVLAVLARLIEPDAFGVMQAALVVVGFAKLMSQMGVGPAIVQKKGLTENHIRTGFTISLTFGIILTLLTFISSDLLAVFFQMPELEHVLKLVSVIFFIESFVVVSQALLQKNLRMKEYAIINLFSYTFGYGIVGIALGFLGYGVYALIWAIIAQTGIKAILATYSESHSRIPMIHSKSFKDLMYFGGGVTTAQFANYLAAEGDNIITGRFLGADALGLYSRAYAVMVKPVNLLGSAVDKALFPSMAFIKDEPERLKSAFLKGLGGLALISFPLSAMMILMGPEIVLVLLGENWTDAILPFQILAVGFAFRMGYKINDTLARATGAVYRGAWRQGIYAFNVIMGSLIGMRWGIEGVACGVVVALFIHYLLTTQLSVSILNVKWWTLIKLHFIPITNAIIAGTAVYVPLLIMRDFTDNSMIVLLATTTSTAVIALLFVKLFPGIVTSQYNRWILDNLLR